MHKTKSTAKNLPKQLYLLTYTLVLAVLILFSQCQCGLLNPTTGKKGSKRNGSPKEDSRNLPDPNNKKGPVNLADLTPITPEMIETAKLRSGFLLATRLGELKDNPNSVGINQPDPNLGNITALHQAAVVGDIAMVKALLDRGAQIDAQDDSNTTPLHRAITRGSIEVATFLIEQGANINATNKDKETPLFLAIDRLAWNPKEQEEKLKLIQTLLAKPQIDINQQNSRGWTALYEAIIRRDFELTEILLNKEGIDVNLIPNNANFTPLLHAIDKKFPQSIVELLLNKAAQVNTPTKDERQTALHLATHMGDLNLVNLLLDKKADVNLPNINGETSLHIATEKGYELIVEAILKAKNVNVNLQDNLGQTPLHKAVANNNAPIVKDLLAINQIKVNLPDNDGNTPLHLAAIHNDEAIVTLLLDKHADKNLSNNQGKKPIELTTNLVIKALLTEP